MSPHHKNEILDSAALNKQCKKTSIQDILETCAIRKNLEGLTKSFNFTEINFAKFSKMHDRACTDEISRRHLPLLKAAGIQCVDDLAKSSP